MELDPFVLSRIQFAANITFHILFPTITIGLGWFLLFFRVRYTQTGNMYWEHAYNFWVKVYALTFALGVVSGITMSFQFGTNWPGFMERTGNIAGPLLGYEVLTAFFLEASFLGIMLFGKQRVSNRTHLISTFLVAFGTSLSAFWILALNSWMHTPAGYEIRDGQFFAESWSAIIFNPSFPYRFTHMMLASLLTSAFLVAGVCAYRIQKGVDGPATKMVLKSGIYTAAMVIPLQILAGDLHGLNTLEHQPAKVAAMEAVWETEKGAGFTIVGIPDEEARETRFAIKIPYAASLILTHDPEGEVKGLNDFEEHPPVGPVFWSFRVMTGVGTLDAFGVLVGRVAAVPPRQAEQLGAAGGIAHDLLGLGGQRGRMVRDRDRSPALDCAGSGIHDRGGRTAPVRDACGHAVWLRGSVSGADDCLHEGAAHHGGEAGQVP